MDNKPGLWQSWPRAILLLTMFYLFGIIFFLGIWKAIELVGGVL